MAGRVVTTVTMSPAPEPVADLTAPTTARFGVTGELSAGNDYATSAQWAQALFVAGHVGVLYQPRFTPGQERALALFDEASRPGTVYDAEAVGRRLVSTSSLAEAVGRLGYAETRSAIPSTPAVAADDAAVPEEA